MKNLLLAASIGLVPLSAHACTANYMPVAGDNTISLNAATAQAASSGTELGLPAALIQISGTWFWPANLHLCGQGQGITIIEKTPNSGTANMVANGRAAPEMIFLNGSVNSSAGNYYIHDLTIDFTGGAQPASQFYFGLIGSYISSFTAERVTFQHPYGGGMFGIVATDALVPTAPDGQQINGNVILRDNTFDGSGQIYGQYADLFDVTLTLNVVIENNLFMNNAASCMSEGMNRNASIRHNSLVNCLRGIYQETSQDFTISDNDIYWTNQSAPSGSPALAAMGIWIADANQTYVNGGYGGNKRGLVQGNHIHDMIRSTGSSGVQGILISAPTLPAQDLVVDGNSVFNSGVSDGSGVVTGIELQGGMDTILVHLNTFRSLLSPSIGVTTGSPYDGVNNGVNIQSVDNFCTGVDSCNSTVTQTCPAGTDPNDPLTVLLLPMQGAAGLTDTSASNHPVTSIGVAVTTKYSVYCGSSGWFNGSAYLSIPDSPDFDSTGDFAIDFWVYPTSESAQTLISKPNANWYSPYKITYSSGEVQLLASSTGSSWDVALLANMGAVPLNAWSHVELDRCGNVYYPFVNGVLGATITNSSTLMTSTDPLKIGMDRTTQFFAGGMQEFRFSKTCHHTVSFTPPTGPY